MTDVRIATSAEQPINSDGAVSTVTGEEGDLVGLDSSGELVAADADDAAAVPAIGVLATPVDDPANYPDGQFEYAAKLAEANRTLINDQKAGFVRYGVEIVNEDEDWGFTPGEPVYLDVGGGFTQSEPTGTTGNVLQSLGVATGNEQVFLDIDADYDTA
jgi:hypothetical protein